MTESYPLPPEERQPHPWQAVAERCEKLERENAELRAQLELARAHVGVDQPDGFLRVKT